MTIYHKIKKKMQKIHTRNSILLPRAFEITSLSVSASRSCKSDPSVQKNNGFLYNNKTYFHIILLFGRHSFFPFLAFLCIMVISGFFFQKKTTNAKDQHTTAGRWLINLDTIRSTGRQWNGDFVTLARQIGQVCGKMNVVTRTRAKNRQSYRGRFKPFAQAMTAKRMRALQNHAHQNEIVAY